MRSNVSFTGKIVVEGHMSHICWMKVLFALALALAACGGGGGVTGEAPQITMFSGSPDTIVAGEPTQLTWTWGYTNDPDSPECEIIEIGPIEMGGTSTVTLAASTTYTLRCTNAAGSDTAVAPVTVALDPVAPVIVTLTANPMQLLTNVAGDVVFTWTYANPPAPSPSCTLDNGIGAVTNGVAKNITLPGTTQLELTCTNSEGMDTQTVTITTVAAPVAFDIATFTTNPTTVIANTATNVTFDWTYNGTPTPAPTCSLDNGLGPTTQGQARSVTIAANTTYTLTCTSSAGTDMQTAVVMAQAQVAPDIAMFSADPGAVTANTDTTVTWNWNYNGTPVPAAACELDNGIGAMTNGGTSTVNLAVDTMYTLTCTNTVGSDTAAFAITVN
ncbi:MAG: hypothetical protein ACKV2T_14710 [Kofleriaceae bacterium]